MRQEIWKKITLIIMIIYIIISPLLIILKENQAYHEGQWNGIYLANKHNEELLKNPQESPQKHFKVGDKIATTDEFYSYLGGTTSFTGWVTEIGKNGTVTIKMNKGSCKCDANRYEINEYWLQKTDFPENDYKEWHWV